MTAPSTSAPTSLFASQRVRRFASWTVIAGLFGGGLVMSVSARTPIESWLRPAEVPAPADNLGTPARVELGQWLFFDPRLTGAGFVSCASCHNPSLAWTDGLPIGIGIGSAKAKKRNTPTILNSGYGLTQGWAGQKKSLEDISQGLVESTDHMGVGFDDVLKRVSAYQEYVARFDKAYPGEGITGKSIGRALAAYQRTVVSGMAPFDRWLAGDSAALGASAQRGFEVFQQQGRCAGCHSGFNFSDNGFHNIGLKPASEESPDLGRFGVLKLPAMKGAFKTPTLRDVALTAPYMHDGRHKTLEEVVEHYDRGGDRTENQSADVRPLNLSPQDKADLVAFLRGLTSAPAAVPVPRLPAR
jgi:cytochrome c peroxidase